MSDDCFIGQGYSPTPLLKTVKDEEIYNHLY